MVLPSDVVLLVEVDRAGRVAVMAAGLKGLEKFGRGMPAGLGEVERPERRASCILNVEIKVAIEVKVEKDVERDVEVEGEVVGQKGWMDDLTEDRIKI